MPNHQPNQPAAIAERIALALAKADGKALQADPDRYRRLAIAALKSLLIPTESMIRAAHAAVQFDIAWAIDTHADFRRAVTAMISFAIAEARVTEA
ncbi:MAG: hypothetical protein ABSE20_22280 [Acetobacteraceae bacterium]|jgi:hypothetical protein